MLNLPALLSVIKFDSSVTQKFPRAATSLLSICALIPNPSKTPLPNKYLIGLYPNNAMCPGPLPGVIPGKTGVETPHVLILDNLSKLGKFAASNSEIPVSGFFIPPNPSATNIMILDDVFLVIACKYGKSIMLFIF